MIKLVIINWNSCNRNFEVLFNPDYIMFIRDGGVNIAGQRYVKMFPCPEAAKFLPRYEDGCVLVKGSYDEITQMIIKAKGGAE